MKWLAVSALFCVGAYFRVHGYDTDANWTFVFAICITLFSGSKFLFKGKK